MCSLGSSWAALRRKILREMAEGSIPSRDCELGKACLESQYISIQTCQPKRLLNRPPSFAFFIVAAKKKDKRCSAIPRSSYHGACWEMGARTHGGPTVAPSWDARRFTARPWEPRDDRSSSGDPGDQTHRVQVPTRTSDGRTEVSTYENREWSLPGGHSGHPSNGWSWTLRERKDLSRLGAEMLGQGPPAPVHFSNSNDLFGRVQVMKAFGKFWTCPEL